MKNRLLTLFLLLSMSFNIAHAYVIEVLDTHSCHVSEYVHDLNDNSETSDNDICHMHHFFHIAIILPEIINELSDKGFTQKPSSNTKTYEYNSYDNFLKPPINA
ncbi:hypothetical protein [Sulfurimonas paralvinellae]|uniref:Uncharacterized protein n=1 Tax=Sulfurimonas paralvinellae TaxID=317658 RepID=A0A7M1B7U7_9BACT|nr:hypothetical protein [Sulfurimonas paralvinellae]QOP44792.1 hypothetical protein FM071_00130 [Sulfurimonas paralvinellae]